MNAVILNAPGDYLYTKVDKPKCNDKGILIKVRACGLCGSDLRTLKSGHPNVKLPAIIGHEVAGRVVEVGKHYNGVYKIADDLAVAPVVYCGTCDFCLAGLHQYCENIRELAQHWPGGFAEYMAIPPESLKLGTIQFKPKNLEFAHAAIAEPPSSCINAQECLNIGIEDTVVIIGAGPAGCIHISIARTRGARAIIIADVNNNRLEMAKEFKPDIVINSSEIDLAQEVKSITCGKGAEVVITANPVGKTQIQAVEMAKKAGRIALFGGLPPNDSKPNIDTNIIHYKGLRIIGTTIFSPKHHRLALDLILRDKIPASKLITHRLPLSEFKQGVKLASEGKALKVVFEM